MARNIRNLTQKFYTCTAYVMNSNGLSHFSVDLQTNSEREARKIIAMQCEVSRDKVIIAGFEEHERKLQIVDLAGAIAAGYIVEVDASDED